MSRKLPPLNALRTFEAAARLSSFTAAANELYVTHGAVSQQIRSLEEYFDQPLFSVPMAGSPLMERELIYCRLSGTAWMRLKKRVRS